MNYFLKSLVLGFMIIGLIILSKMSVSASTQNQTACENMAGGGNQNMTAQQDGNSVPNSMVADNQSSGGVGAPGYIQITASREVNASADDVFGVSYEHSRPASLSS